MFPRKKKNRTGTISVVVVDGTYHEYTRKNGERLIVDRVTHRRSQEISQIT